MKNRLISWLLTSVVLVAVLLGQARPAATQLANDPYIWQKLLVVPNASPSAAEQDVRDELNDEVLKFLAWANQTNPPRAPGPYYVAPGYIAENLYWLNPGESVLALSETLDFLPDSTRSQLIAYLKYVMQTPSISPLTFRLQNNVAHPLMNKANYRNQYPALPDELARGFITATRESEIVPPPENLYAVWAFAYYVSRYEGASTPKAWDIVNANWSAVDSLYSRAPATSRIYWDILAHIGYARLAKRLGKPFATAESRANSGYTAGANYIQFYQNMKTARWCEGNGSDQSWVGVWDYCAFAAIQPYAIYPNPESNRFNHNAYAGQLLNNRQTMFAPEIGRFLHDQAQSAVVDDAGYGLRRFLDPAGAAYFPFWWENRGDKPWGLRDANTASPGNGENAIMHPSFAWQMFMLKAHVEGAGLSPSRAETMRVYLDTPWAIGDVFHLQKLTTVLRMYSTIQWTQADVGTTTLAVTPAAARQGQTLSFVVTVAGTGQPITLSDPLPAGLAYASNTNACPGSVNVAGNTVTYTGAPAQGAFCTLTIRANVTTAQTLTVNDGAAPPYTLSAVALLNPLNTLLPQVRR